MEEAHVWDQMRSLVARTRGDVVVTRGSDATLAIGRDGTAYRVESNLPTRIVSAIGCGDCFAAGAALRLASGATLPEMLRLGSACAIANLATPHAAHFEPGDVSALESQQVVRCVS